MNSPVKRLHQRNPEILDYKWAHAGNSNGPFISVSPKLLSAVHRTLDRRLYLLLLLLLVLFLMFSLLMISILLHAELPPPRRGWAAAPNVVSNRKVPKHVVHTYTLGCIRKVRERLMEREGKGNAEGKRKGETRSGGRAVNHGRGSPVRQKSQGMTWRRGNEKMIEWYYYC